jgi:hypothetical protein
MAGTARGSGVLAAVVFAACGGASGGLKPGAATTRDSAGISIVENSGPAWSAQARWTVVDSPLVDISGKGGDSGYEVDQVRGPVRLADGRIAIANASTNDIRIYDSQGKHLHTSGRAGSGPGEYSMIAGIWRGPGDSLVIDDILIRRITLLDHDGNVGRVFSLGGSPGTLIPTNGQVNLAVPVGLFADGSMVGVSQSLGINQQRSGVFRDSVTVIHYGSDGAVHDTLGRFPGTEMEQLTLHVAQQEISSPSPVPLGKQTVVLVDRGRLAIAQNNTWELELRSAEGKLRTLARAPYKAARLTPSDIAANRKEQLRSLEASPMFRSIPDAIKTQLRGRVEQVNYPATLPFFASLLADPTGNVWAEEAAPPTRKAKRFVVVDSTGRWLGTVEFPRDFRPTLITEDAAYGVWKDENDVEHVRGYRLHKPQPN